jgi:hypothetical protein
MPGRSRHSGAPGQRSSDRCHRPEQGQFSTPEETPPRHAASYGDHAVSGAPWPSGPAWRPGCRSGGLLRGVSAHAASGFPRRFPRGRPRSGASRCTALSAGAHAPLPFPAPHAPRDRAVRGFAFSPAAGPARRGAAAPAVPGRRYRGTRRTTPRTTPVRSADHTGTSLQEGSL